MDRLGGEFVFRSSVCFFVCFEGVGHVSFKCICIEGLQTHGLNQWIKNLHMF